MSSPGYWPTTNQTVLISKIDYDKLIDTAVKYDDLMNKALLKSEEEDSNYIYIIKRWRTRGIIKIKYDLDPGPKKSIRVPLSEGEASVLVDKKDYYFTEKQAMKVIEEERQKEIKDLESKVNSLYSLEVKVNGS